jgi:hypothetical protein
MDTDDAPSPWRRVKPDDAISLRHGVGVVVVLAL